MSDFENEGKGWKDLIGPDEDLTPADLRSAEISVNVGLMQRRRIAELEREVAALRDALHGAMEAYRELSIQDYLTADMRRDD